MSYIYTYIVPIYHENIPDLIVNVYIGIWLEIVHHVIFLAVKENS